MSTVSLSLSLVVQPVLPPRSPIPHPSLPHQVFEVMNSYNLGCGPGGGDSAPQVFRAVGLAFSDGDLWTPVRESENWQEGAVGGKGGPRAAGKWKRAGPVGQEAAESGGQGPGLF